MKLLYAACLHHPEDFEQWLIPYLKQRCELLLLDYRAFHGTFQDINESLPEIVETHGITHVLLMKGELIKPETITTILESGVKVACWTIDDHFHPEHFTSPYSTIFTPSPFLIDHYRERGIKNVVELPFYVEPEIFGNAKLKNDFQLPVSFLGTKYPGREDKITHLREHGVEVGLWGDQWGIQNNGRLASFTDVLDLFCSSAINLNIHQPSMVAVGSLNTKVYEIPAAGGFMIVDYFPMLLERFRSDEIVVYDPDDYGSLEKCVRYWLDDSEGRAEVIMRARERIFREHTAEKRVELILANI